MSWASEHERGVDATCAVVTLDDVDRAVIRGAPLPADHRRRSRALANRLEADPAAPPQVQSAARCLLAAIGGSGVDEVAAIDARPVNWDGIEVAYVCNNVFRVRNSNLRDVPVTFDLEGTAVRGDMVLPRNGHQRGGYSEITFAVPKAGTLRLLHEGVVMKTASHQRTRCNTGR